MLTIRLRNASCDIEIDGLAELLPADNPVSLPAAKPRAKKAAEPAIQAEIKEDTEPVEPDVPLLDEAGRVAWVKSLVSDPEKITLIRSMMGEVKVSQWPDDLQLAIRREFVKRGWPL